MDGKAFKLVDNPNLRGQTYKILKNMIILRKVEPGKKICEETLAREIGVSRTPIREALCRLEHEGIVKIVPRRGAFVADPSQSNIKDILYLREVLEGLVVRLVTPTLTGETLRKLRECLEQLLATPEEQREAIEYTDAEVEFHALLLSQCENQILNKVMEMVYAHLQIVRLRTVVLPGRAKKSLEEHRLILEALEKRDAGQAEAMMRAHVASVRQAVLDNMGAIV